MASAGASGISTNLSVAALHLVDVIRCANNTKNKPVLITVSIAFYYGLLWKKPLNLNLFWSWGAAAGHFDWSSQDAPTDVTDLLPATVPLRCATWLGWPGWGLGWRPGIWGICPWWHGCWLCLNARQSLDCCSLKWHVDVPWSRWKRNQAINWNTPRLNSQT